jgi:uncharacterized membrane protein
MSFRDETTNVLIGGYLSVQAAREDYNAVLNCGERIWGAAVVSKDLTGTVTVEKSDHAVAEGATGGAGIGLVVGLFAPPVLAATVLGAALGAAGGAVVHKKLGEGIGETAGETIPIGGAGLLVAYPHAHADTVEPAVRRAIQKVVGQAKGSHVDALKGALADAQAKLAEVTGG